MLHSFLGLALSSSRWEEATEDVDCQTATAAEKALDERAALKAQREAACQQRDALQHRKYAEAEAKAELAQIMRAQKDQELKSYKNSKESREQEEKHRQEAAIAASIMRTKAHQKVQEDPEDGTVDDQTGDFAMIDAKNKKSLQETIEDKNLPSSQKSYFLKLVPYAKVYPKSPDPQMNVFTPNNAIMMATEGKNNPNLGKPLLLQGDQSVWEMELPLKKPVHGDRGLWFGEFGKLLSELYPNLEELKFESTFH